MEKRQKRHLLTFAFVATFFIPLQSLMAQDGIGFPKPDVVEVAEVMPVLESCAALEDRTERETCSNQGMMEYIMGNLTYPQIARDKGIEGTVYVQFVVTKKGSIGSVEIVRGPDLLQKAAFSVIQSLPKFIPGTDQGKTVDVQYVLPIRFALGE
jgi:TonB family protein